MICEFIRVYGLNLPCHCCAAVLLLPFYLYFTHKKGELHVALLVYSNLPWFAEWGGNPQKSCTLNHRILI